MQLLRLHDPSRRPANWTDIVRPHQFAAFARDADTGASCAPDGVPFTDPGTAACVLFDSLDEARTFCEAAAAATPRVRFDVFDAHGRANPPLFTIVHPSRAAGLESHPDTIRRRRLIAGLLIGGGIPLLVWAYLLKDAGHAVFPGFIGLNMLIAALRILWLDLSIRETERTREARLAAAKNSRSR